MDRRRVRIAYQGMVGGSFCSFTCERLRTGSWWCLAGPPNARPPPPAAGRERSRWQQRPIPRAPVDPALRTNPSRRMNAPPSTRRGCPGVRPGVRPGAVLRSLRWRPRRRAALSASTGVWRGESEILPSFVPNDFLVLAERSHASGAQTDRDQNFFAGDAILGLDTSDVHCIRRCTGEGNFHASKRST